MKEEFCVSLYRISNPGPAQGGAPLKFQKTKFPKYAKDLIVKIVINFLVPNTNPKGYAENSKTTFPPTYFLNVFVGNKSHSAKKGALRSQNASSSRKQVIQGGTL